MSGTAHDRNGWLSVSLLAAFLFLTLGSGAVWPATGVAPAFCSTGQASAWELDPAATRIAFSVKNLSVAYVTGTFRLASGRVVLDDGDLSRGTIEAVIDAGSIDTDEPKRDAHLRSADFLDVARYPTIAFQSTRIEQAEGDHWKVR